MDNNDSCGSANGLFATTSEKLVLLSACTYGAYSWYWIFRNWERIRAITNEPFSPVIRTWLFPFYNFALFSEVSDLAKTAGVEVRWRPYAIYFSYMCLLLGWFFPITFIISVFVGIALLPVNATCAEINKEKELGGGIQGFGKMDWFIMATGGTLVIMSFIRSVLRFVVPAY